MKDNKLFNRIARIYGLFYSFQKRKFQNVVEAAKPYFDIAEFQNVLDVGCGTGALCSVLSQYNIDITGVDSASKMVEVARQKNSGNKIKFLHHDATQKLPFDDDTFDIAMASYVAHGLKPDERKAMLKDMQRVSSKYVVLHEFSKHRSIKVDIIEWLEGGNYFTFLKNIEDELNEIFGEYQIIKIDKNAYWYVMKV